MIALALASSNGRIGDYTEAAKESGGATAAGVCVAFGPATGGASAAVSPLCYVGGKWIVGSAIEYGGKIIEAVKCTFSICGDWKGSNRDEAFEGTREKRFYDLYNTVAPLCKTDACKARWLELVNWYVDAWKNVDITQEKYQSEGVWEGINVFKDYGWQRYLDDVSARYRDEFTPNLQTAMQEMLNQQEIDLGRKPPAEGTPAGAPAAPAAPGMSTGAKIAVASLAVGAAFAGWRYWKKGRLR